MKTELRICEAGELADRQRKVVRIGDFEFGIFNLGGEYFAYENRCPHFDGPVCQGVVAPLFTEGVCADRTSLGRVFSKDGFNVVCPWHGYEFDIRTGRHPTYAKMRLKPVPLSVRDGQIYATIPVA